MAEAVVAVAAAMTRTAVWALAHRMAALDGLAPSVGAKAVGITLARASRAACTPGEETFDVPTSSLIDAANDPTVARARAALCSMLPAAAEATEAALAHHAGGTPAARRRVCS